MKLLYFILLLSMLSVSALGKPADRRMRTYKQSDGSTLTYRQMGDEYFHYYCTADGKPLVRETNGDFSYAAISADGQLVSSSLLAHDKEARTTAEHSLLSANTYAGMEELLHKTALQRRVASTKGVVPTTEYSDTLKQTIKPIGKINVPVLLVQYQDVKFTFGKEMIAKNYNGENFVGLNGKGIGSVRDYFISQSDSLFTPNFVVLDVVTLANNMEYYGANDASGDDMHPEEMVTEACAALDANVDFSIFDNDGDGEVEFVYCVYAGYSESSDAPENTVWPHQWTLSATNKVMTVDGVKINKYATSSELAYNEETQGENGAQLDGKGSCCHEFSHCLGLPDFYDTSGRSYANFGMDYWDLMDYGCYNLDGYVPIGYSAYERDFMGWRKLQPLTTRGNYSMKALTEGGIGYKITSDVNVNEYYILENRQASGYDAHIFNSGMLIVHVDYSENVWGKNEVNSNLALQRYTLIPADNKLLTYYRAISNAQYEASLRGDVWPGTSGNKELTNESTPAATLHTGGYMNKSVRNIALEDGVIYFSFMKDSLSSPVLSLPSAVSSAGFTVEWDTVQYADLYEVELIRVDKVKENEGDIYNLLTEDFLGCNLAATEITDKLDSYTIESGWNGYNLWSETGVLRIGSSSDYGELYTPFFATPADGDITVCFSAKKYSSSDAAVTLSLYSEFKDADAEDYDVFEIGNEWENYWYTFSKEGSEASLFFTTEDSENTRVCIDDIIVTQESTEREVVIGSYETSATEFSFSGLSEGKYRCRVRAKDSTDDGVTSKYSSKLEIILGDNTGISFPDNDSEDENVEIYSLTGVTIYKGTKKNIPRLQPAVYVVRQSGKIQKMLIK